MTAEDLRKIINYLQELILLDENETDDNFNIKFILPQKSKLLDAGLNEDGISHILNSDWLDEMVTDIIETPDFCEPDEKPKTILKFAKDVVAEYVKKRFTLPLDE